MGYEKFYFLILMAQKLKRSTFESRKKGKSIKADL